MISRRLLAKLLISLAFLPSLLLAQGEVQVHETEQIQVELVAETRNVVPGESTWLAIRLAPIEHWHTYWKFGGDSGEATEALNWRLPDAVEVGEIVWPIPEWTPFLGSELVTFTYEREVLLPMRLRVPADFDGDELTVATTIAWQVCEQICIPGQADFSLTLPVGETLSLDPRWQPLFAETRARTPLPADQHELTARFNDHDGRINVMVEAPGDQFANVDEAWFFPTESRIMQYAPYRDVMVDGDRLQISTEQHRRYEGAESLEGLLAFIDEQGNWHGYDIAPQRSSVAWDHSMEVELLAETTNVVPGETTWLGLRLDPAEHWHTYWKMGGDSGEPTSLNEWEAPPGTRIGEIQWPAPHWLPFYETDLVNFGYEQEVLLPVAVTIPADYEGDSVTVSTLAYWNVC
ncbi:MAG: protein-disulfide reductase DsbD domain-containing protein, partial [Pseudohongiellaceae bacterium]